MTVKDKMKLLGFQDITTPRQKKNGTKIFKLPIKMYGRYIKVGSFKSGYVRRLECIGYRSESSYQLNKRIESKPQYYKSSKKDSMDRPLYSTNISNSSCCFSVFTSYWYTLPTEKSNTVIYFIILFLT